MRYLPWILQCIYAFPLGLAALGLAAAGAPAVWTALYRLAIRKVCFLFDFVFILAKPLELMFIILKQL